ncbi:MAG: molybdopterin oxidoreductase [Bdellovibrionaceae bacterium]|nr:molybdopterin oxidoreductase [Pseudobdellovibrionaceae bacterium]
MASTNHTDLHVSQFKPSSNQKTLAIVLLAIGLITFAIGVMKSPERVWTSYLVAFFYFSCLGLGGLFFVAVNHVAKAGWSVSVRRLAEAMTSFIPLIFLGGLVLLAGFKNLYTWADPQFLAENPLIAAKAGYLNTSSFIMRLIVFCGGWVLFKWFIIGNSIKQDQTGDANLTHKNVGLSIGFILFFSLSFSLFSIDLIMSLMPGWYSTIFGIYCFSGMFQATFAVLALMIIFLRSQGLVKGYLTEEHQHDVVKFMKGFTVFWAYIAFSQFMLIWYANIPEETEYYIMRSQNGWLGISFGLLIFRFIIPFLALLPRAWKRNNAHVTAVAFLILIMQYVDIYWMVYPNFFDGQVIFGFWEIGIFAGFTGIFLLGLFTFMQKFSLVPLRDPRIAETISHHVTY